MSGTTPAQKSVAPSSPQHLGASPGARQQIRQVIGGYEVQQQITWLNETRGVGAEDNTLFADIQFAELGAEQIVEKALQIAASICVYTNENIVIEKLEG